MLKKILNSRSFKSSPVPYSLGSSSLSEWSNCGFHNDWVMCLDHSNYINLESSKRQCNIFVYLKQFPGLINQQRNFPKCLHAKKSSWICWLWAINILKLRRTCPGRKCRISTPSILQIFRVNDPRQLWSEYVHANARARAHTHTVILLFECIESSTTAKFYLHTSSPVQTRNMLSPRSPWRNNGCRCLSDLRFEEVNIARICVCR